MDHDDITLPSGTRERRHDQSFDTDGAALQDPPVGENIHDGTTGTRPPLSPRSYLTTNNNTDNFNNGTGHTSDDVVMNADPTSCRSGTSYNDKLGVIEIIASAVYLLQGPLTKRRVANLIQNALVEYHDQLTTHHKAQLCHVHGQHLAERYKWQAEREELLEEHDAELARHQRISSDLVRNMALAKAQIEEETQHLQHRVLQLQSTQVQSLLELQDVQQDYEHQRLVDELTQLKDRYYRDMVECRRTIRQLQEQNNDLKHSKFSAAKELNVLIHRMNHLQTDMAQQQDQTIPRLAPCLSPKRAKSKAKKAKKNVSFSMASSSDSSTCSTATDDSNTDNDNHETPPSRNTNNIHRQSPRRRSNRDVLNTSGSTYPSSSAASYSTGTHPLLTLLEDDDPITNVILPTLSNFFEHPSPLNTSGTTSSGWQSTTVGSTTVSSSPRHATSRSKRHSHEKNSNIISDRYDGDQTHVSSRDEILTPKVEQQQNEERHQQHNRRVLV